MIRQQKKFRQKVLDFDLIIDYTRKWQNINTFQKYPPELDKLKLSMVFDILHWPILAKQPMLGRPSFEVVSSLMLNFKMAVSSKTASNCNINQRAGKLKINKAMYI